MFYFHYMYLTKTILWLYCEHTLLILCILFVGVIVVMPYFGKRKQVTYHLKLDVFCILPSMLFFQAKSYA